LTGVLQPRLKVLENPCVLGRIAEPQHPRFESPECDAPEAPLVALSRSSSSYSSLFLSAASPFEVRVMGVDTITSPVRWYLVRLVCKQRPGCAWEVLRRFSEFDTLARRVRSEDDESSLLPRKVPSLLLSATEQQRRIVGLQRFAAAMLASPTLLAQRAVADFFDLDFGLWHASPTPSPRVDRAIQRAARMLQAWARRCLFVRRLHRVRAAAEVAAVMAGAYSSHARTKAPKRVGLTARAPAVVLAPALPRQHGRLLHNLSQCTPRLVVPALS